jgi:hypothetical protein
MLSVRFRRVGERKYLSAFKNQRGKYAQTVDKEWPKIPIPPWVCFSRFKHFSDKFLHIEYRAQVLSKHTLRKSHKRVFMLKHKKAY